MLRYVAWRYAMLYCAILLYFTWFRLPSRLLSCSIFMLRCLTLRYTALRYLTLPYLTLVHFTFTFMFNIYLVLVSKFCFCLCFPCYLTMLCFTWLRFASPRTTYCTLVHSAVHYFCYSILSTLLYFTFLHATLFHFSLLCFALLCLTSHTLLSLQPTVASELHGLTINCSVSLHKTSLFGTQRRKHSVIDEWSSEGYEVKFEEQ